MKFAYGESINLKYTFSDFRQMYLCNSNPCQDIKHCYYSWKSSCVHSRQSLWLLPLLPITVLIFFFNHNFACSRTFYKWIIWYVLSCIRLLLCTTVGFFWDLFFCFCSLFILLLSNIPLYGYITDCLNCF